MTRNQGKLVKVLFISFVYRKFQSETAKLILKNADLPKNLAPAIVNRANDDIATPISQIKRDAYVVEHNSLPLLSAMLLTLLEKGEFNCRSNNAN
jgi:hypothetical protein